LRQGSELASGGTIFSYDGRFGFIGLFIVRRELRGAGLGTQLWHHRLKRLRDRLLPGAPIGMDGVFAMVPFYERGGFALAYRDLRFEGIARGTADPRARSLDPPMFTLVEAFDRAYVPAPRPSFLGQWMY
jgi:GNAT superfamily N-acetyltransferase